MSGIKGEEFIRHYSLIGGLAMAVICRWYFGDQSDDLNPMLMIYRNTFIYGPGRIKKTGKPVKSHTTTYW